MAAFISALFPFHPHRLLFVFFGQSLPAMNTMYRERRNQKVSGLSVRISQHSSFSFPHPVGFLSEDALQETRGPCTIQAGEGGSETGDACFFLSPLNSPHGRLDISFISSAPHPSLTSSFSDGSQVSAPLSFFFCFFCFLFFFGVRACTCVDLSMSLSRTFA